METYIDWLNNAYAMEQDIATTLEKQIDQVKENQEVKSQLLQHLETTKSQVTRLQSCIERLNGNVSKAKSFTATLMGTAKGTSTAMMDDKEVKNIVADYAVEHMEIGTYTSLIAAANFLEDTETVAILEEIREEEIEMARWIEKRLSQVTTSYLSGL